MASGDVNARLTKVRTLKGNAFDNVDDYISVPHDARQLGANLTNGFTVSCWLNLKSAGEGGATGSGRIISKQSGAGNDGFCLQSRQDNNKMNFYLVATNKLTETTAITFGVWVHYLITVTGANPAIGNMYKNGVNGASVNYNLVNSVANITVTTNLFLGSTDATGSQTANGSIRDFKMWNRVLTAAEIASDYAGTTPTSGLIHRFKLGGDYADYGAVGVTATNSGSVPALVDDALAAAVKAQRVASTDKWMIYRGRGGQVGTVNIE